MYPSDCCSSQGFSERGMAVSSNENILFSAIVLNLISNDVALSPMLEYVMYSLEQNWWDKKLHLWYGKYPYSTYVVYSGLKSDPQVKQKYPHMPVFNQ